MNILKRLAVSGAAGALVLGSVASSVLAAPTENQNCWGTVVSQRASTYHDIGIHSASQEEPRVGVGNLAHDVFNMSVGDLAALLGALDDGFGQDPLGATHCP